MKFATAGKLLLLPALFAGLLVLGNSVNAGGEKVEKGFKKLFNGKNLEGWKFQLSNKNADPSKTFYVKDGVIVVSGRPNGYFYTDKSYKNFVLRYDWKFSNSKPNSNSGLLVHIQPPQKVWPKCVEVQGAQGDHARIFAIGGARGKFKVNKKNQQKAIKLGDWNTTEVVSRNGTLSSKINGIPIASGKSGLMEGPFGFQSEGTELYFKNIRIKVMK